LRHFFTYLEFNYQKFEILTLARKLTIKLLTCILRKRLQLKRKRLIVSLHFVQGNFLCIRTNIPKPEVTIIPFEEQGDAADVELKMAKKFQHWQDMKMKINKNDIKEVEVAKKKGRLHACLLDRRAAMKSDKYCK